MGKAIVEFIHHELLTTHRYVSYRRTKLWQDREEAIARCER